MRLGIIIGSNREQSQSGRIGGVIDAIIGRLYPQVETDTFDLASLDVPLWTMDKWAKDSAVVAAWQPISERLKACDGFVVVSPEWAGMSTPHLKNFLLMCEGGELAHKPGLIVAVSASTGGAYVVAELRMSGYKNSFIWWLPEHIICRNVGSLFCDKDEKSDAYIGKRLEYALKLLVESSVAFAPLREEIQDLKSYPFGM